MGSFGKPKWEDDDWKVRLEAVKKLYHEGILRDIALNDSNSEVRKAAVKKIKDTSILINIARYGSDYFICSEAIKNIKDKSVLVDIAKNDSDDFLRKAAIKNINNQSDLIDIAKNESNRDIREAAIYKIRDTSALVDIACSSDDYIYVIRRKLMNDKSALRGIANNASNPDVRKEAISGIVDKSVLEDIALNDSDSSVREAANKQIKTINARKTTDKKHANVKCPHCNSFDVDYFNIEYDDNYRTGYTCNNCGREFRTHREWKGENYTYNI